ncbi:sugar nucleotide-binding protein, partial [Streptococcus suis]
VQHGRPNWTRNIAEFMVQLFDTKHLFGYYYLSNDAAEDTTWFDFATDILKDTITTVLPVDSSQFPAMEKRPFISTMSLDKA